MSRFLENGLNTKIGKLVIVIAFSIAELVDKVANVLKVKFSLNEVLHTKLIFDPLNYLHSSLYNKLIYDEIFIITGDGEKLHGCFLPAINASNKAIIYFHGNEGNICTWYKSCKEMQEHIDANILLVDYRGYGKSSGKPSRQGIIKDAVAMYDYLIKKKYKPKDICLYGISLGGAIALELATRREISAIAIQSTFSSLKDVAINIHYMLERYVRNDLLNSLLNIKKVNVPKLICHGLSDTVIPIANSERLFNEAAEPKKLMILNGGHDDISDFFDSGYYKTISEVFDINSVSS